MPGPRRAAASGSNRTQHPSPGSLALPRTYQSCTVRCARFGTAPHLHLLRVSRLLRLCLFLLALAVGGLAIPAVGWERMCITRGAGVMQQGSVYMGCSNRHARRKKAGAGLPGPLCGTAAPGGSGSTGTCTRRQGLTKSCQPPPSPCQTHGAMSSHPPGTASRPAAQALSWCGPAPAARQAEQAHSRPQ